MTSTRQNTAVFPPACLFSRYGHALPWRATSIDPLSGRGVARQQGAYGVSIAENEDAHGPKEQESRVYR